MEQHLEFEYGKYFYIPDRNPLEKYLASVWQQYALLNDYTPDTSEEAIRQSFLSFDGNKARAKNFIGFIQTDDCQIEIYPKIFKEQIINSENKKLFLQHIFYWFDYCRKWKFPFTNVDLDLFNDVDLPELILNIMANRILEAVSNNPISLYREVEESLIMPKGRLNFSRYISKGLVNGNQHLQECDYELFTYDNTLNRVIKYVTRLLNSKSKYKETNYKLNEIIFLLDDVEDVICSVNQLNEIKLNAFFTDYKAVIDICQMVLEQQLYSHEYYQKSQWCLLFPMEYVFEDFIAGFLESRFSDAWKVHYQKSDMNLSNNPEAFNMKHDILLISTGDEKKQIIVDTKYKLRIPPFEDNKKGISQSDMYQMTSYAFRRGCNNVLLLYPNFSENLLPDNTYTIQSNFDSKDKIRITAAEVPFWSMENFSKKYIDTNLEAKLSALLKTF